MKIVQFCLKQAMPLNLLVFVILTTGIYEAITMKREAFPAVDFDIVNISTYWPGASPKEVEQFVTNPIEREVETLTGINEILSSSKESSSTVILKLDPELSQDRKKTVVNDIQRAVDAVTDLPDDIYSAPHVKEVNSEDFAVMEVGVFGDMNYS